MGRRVGTLTSASKSKSSMTQRTKARRCLTISCFLLSRNKGKATKRTRSAWIVAASASRERCRLSLEGVSTSSRDLISWRRPTKKLLQRLSSQDGRGREQQSGRITGTTHARRQVITTLRGVSRRSREDRKCWRGRRGRGASGGGQEPAC